MFEDLLHTISQVTVTLAGFSGVVFALGGRSGGELSEKEESGGGCLYINKLDDVDLRVLGKMVERAYIH
jgi:hypothetical protein